MLSEYEAEKRKQQFGLVAMVTATGQEPKAI